MNYPFESDRPQILDFAADAPAVTYDMRRAGVGILTHNAISLSAEDWSMK